MAKNMGLVIKSDLDLWILVNTPDVTEEDVSVKLQMMDLNVEILDRKNRRLMQVRAREVDDPVDVTIISNTVLSALDPRRAVVAGGLLLSMNINYAIANMSDKKKKMTQDIVVAIKLCAYLASVNIKGFTLEYVAAVAVKSLPEGVSNQKVYQKI